MNPENTILSIIKKFRDEYGCDGLSDGNCGTFSLSLYKILRELNLSPSIGFSYLETSPESITIKEVILNETDIHHVFIEVGGNKYDCSGKIDDDYLAEFSRREYGILEENVGIFHKIDEWDGQWNDLLSLIRNDTNWKISTEEFYNFYLNIQKLNESESKDGLKLSSDQLLDWMLNNNLNNSFGEMDYDELKHISRYADRWELKTFNDASIFGKWTFPSKNGTPRNVPIIVVDNGDGKYEVLDGKHRVAEHNYYKKPIKAWVGKSWTLTEINIRKKGSCMYYAEKVNDALLKKGITGYKVVEGYVRFKKNGGKSFTPNFQHTWIEMGDGRIIDKTKVQFSEYDISTIQYMLNGRKEYSPEEYKKLCSEHPVDMNGDSIIKESVSGFDRPAYWFYEDFGMKIGVELRGDSLDKIRISTANSAKTKRIIPLIEKVKQELIKLKYSPIDIDVIFTSRKIVPSTEKITNRDLIGRGYAKLNSDGSYYFLMNIDYLTGKSIPKTLSAIEIFVHEWSHIWFFLNETDNMRKRLKNLLNNLRGKYRKLLPTGEFEDTVLTDGDGDELWAYMNTQYSSLPNELKDAYWKIREDSSMKSDLFENYSSSWIEYSPLD